MTCGEPKSKEHLPGRQYLHNRMVNDLRKDEQKQTLALKRQNPHNRTVNDLREKQQLCTPA
jgi:hypothetical protein